MDTPMTMLSSRRDFAIMPSSSPAAAPSPGTEPAAVASRGVLHDAKITRELAEIAFIGAFCGKMQAAETIFRSLRLLCPGNPYVELGMAMVCAIDDRPMDGLSLVERIPMSPDTQQGLGPRGSASLGSAPSDSTPSDSAPSGFVSPGLVPLCAGLMLQAAGHHAAAEKKFMESISQGGEVAALAGTLSSAKRD